MAKTISEQTIEQATLDWFEAVGFDTVRGVLSSTLEGQTLFHDAFRMLEDASLLPFMQRREAFEQE